MPGSQASASVPTYVGIRAGQSPRLSAGVGSDVQLESGYLRLWMLGRDSRLVPTPTDGKRGRGAERKGIVVIAVEVHEPKGLGRTRMRRVPDASGASQEVEN